MNNPTTKPPKSLKQKPWSASLELGPGRPIGYLVSSSRWVALVQIGLQTTYQRTPSISPKSHLCKLSTWVVWIGGFVGSGFPFTLYKNQGFKSSSNPSWGSQNSPNGHISVCQGTLFGVVSRGCHWFCKFFPGYLDTSSQTPAEKPKFLQASGVD